MNNLITKFSLITILSLITSACGGGGSTDSGGVQSDVTGCITTESVVSSLGLSQTIFTNSCDFAVTLGRGLTSVSTIVTLEPGATNSEFTPVGGFIACRPPSQPFDQDDSTLRDFACTG